METYKCDPGVEVILVGAIFVERGRLAGDQIAEALLKVLSYPNIRTLPEYIAAEQRIAANAIRQELAASHPDLAALNAKCSFWSNVQKVADATLQRRTGQVGGILGDRVAELGGILLNGASGGIKGALANAVRKPRSAQLLGLAERFSGTDLATQFRPESSTPRRALQNRLQ